MPDWKVGRLYKAVRRRHIPDMEKALSAVPVPVALARCADYDAPGSGRNVFRVVKEVLDASGLRVPRGARVLVKPNLITARALACTDPRVTEIGRAHV